MTRTVCLLVIGLIFVACPAFAQEIYVHGGVTSQTGSASASSAWALSYLHGLGDYAALSLTYLNEGHVADHKRDGLSLQFWGRYPLFDRKVSLAAGVGPYLYYDTVKASDGFSYTNTHGVGGVASLSATLYTESRFLFQLRGNWIWTPQNANTYVSTFGIGYQLEKGSKEEKQEAKAGNPPPVLNNEVALMAGMTILNEWSGNASSGAGSLEYRRRFGNYIEWTAGWLLEGGSISRNGPATQIWAGKRFFDDRFSLGVGAGPYLGFDNSDGSITRLNWLVSASASYAFQDHWAVRATWHRVTTDYDRDSDIFLSGISYRF